MTETQSGARVPGARGDEERARHSQGGREPATGQGRTEIADHVVAKIAGMAAREVSGVYAMGGGTARALGAVRDAFSSGGEGAGAARGVAVEVGERQAAVDIDVVVQYGVAIPDLASAVRRNVVGAVERMTGLEVTEVNIQVNDIHLPDDDRADDKADDKGRGADSGDKQSRVR